MTNSKKKIGTAEIFQIMDERAKKYGGRLPLEAFETTEELYAFFQAHYDELSESFPPQKSRKSKRQKTG